ncbi:MAG: ATP-dependent Clp protease adaptor ClpS [Thermoleophilia bacterium]|nr:ATP-dependent Clp protease adaptor ClpS [Thermoleophilia bacterium]
MAQIVVLNDDHNTFEGVAGALARVLPGVAYEDGLKFATAIHMQGQATVWTGPREIAELYWDQLNEAQLTMAPLT